MTQKINYIGREKEENSSRKYFVCYFPFFVKLREE